MWFTTSRRLGKAFQVLTLSSFIFPYCCAQNDFSWSLIPDVIGNNVTLLSCHIYDFQLNRTDATNPINYTLRAFAPNAVPIFVDLGSFPQSTRLGWQALLPIGTQFLLSIVGSDGSQGGVSGLTSVNANNLDTFKTPCNPSPLSTSDFKVTLNATKVSRCQGLEVTFAGGKGPYAVTFVVEGGLESAFGYGTTYTWNNEAPPGSHVLISAIDSMGMLAESPGLVSSSPDTDCPPPTTTSTSHPTMAAPPVDEGNTSQSKDGLKWWGKILVAILVCVLIYLLWRLYYYYQMYN